MPAATRYTATAIVLHWAMAVFIVVNFTLGWTVSDLPDDVPHDNLIDLHKSIGATILALAAARLLWRLSHRPPPFPDHVVAWQRGLAHAVHFFLYLLFFAVPVTGWLYSSASGYPVELFGWFTLPDLIHADQATADTLGARHAQLAYSLAALVSLHVLAAIKHGFDDPTRYFSRILSSRPEGGP